MREVLKPSLNVCKDCNINPRDMWNFDERGFMMGRGGKKNELGNL